MAFLFSWIAVLPLLLNRTLPAEPFQILGALAGPTLSAVIVIAVIEGRPGLKTFFKRYLQWRAGIIWWLLVLFGILIALNVVAAVILGPAVLAEFVRNLGLILPDLSGDTDCRRVSGSALGGAWLAWLCFARLQERYHPLLGSIILGVLWAVWHAPGYPGGWMVVVFRL
jgi:membrane protease YdiL (CAAX protease family)